MKCEVLCCSIYCVCNLMGVCTRAHMSMNKAIQVTLHVDIAPEDLCRAAGFGQLCVSSWTCMQHNHITNGFEIAPPCQLEHWLLSSFASIVWHQYLIKLLASNRLLVIWVGGQTFIFLVTMGGSSTLLLCKGFVPGLERLLLCLEESCISGKCVGFTSQAILKFKDVHL